MLTEKPVFSKMLRAILNSYNDPRLSYLPVDGRLLTKVTQFCQFYSLLARLFMISFIHYIPHHYFHKTIALIISTVFLGVL